MLDRGRCRTSSNRIQNTRASPPGVMQDTLPWVQDANVADWLYDEIERVGEGSREHLLHSILLSNGWELQIPFRDVQTTTTFPLLPHPSKNVVTPPAVQT